MKKCCFIILYFGKLPKYFEIFAKTCSINEEYKWLIFTDDNESYQLPKNVEIIKSSFEDIVKRIQGKFDFKISLNEPYKLCDYKPAFGYIFEDYIKDYMFWGHCDLDTIMGNLNNFLTNNLLENYDKIFCLGHMELYKNNYYNNRLFMEKYCGKYLYKEAFRTDEIVVFDEVCKNRLSVNDIFLQKKKKVYTKDESLNIQIFPTKFIRVLFNYESKEFYPEIYKNALYVWNKGDLLRYYVENGKLMKEEFLYAHLQKRNMQVDKRILKDERFKIIPNEFLRIEEKEISLANFNKIKKSKICFHFLDVHFNNKIKKIKKFLKNK